VKPKFFANSPSQTLHSKTDAKQDEAGGRKLRDRMIPDDSWAYIYWTAAKATRWVIRLSERSLTWPAPPAGGLIKAHPAPADALRQR
jgi:hypothetical protein